VGLPDVVDAYRDGIYTNGGYFNAYNNTVENAGVGARSENGWLTLTNNIISDSRGAGLVSWQWGGMLNTYNLMSNDAATYGNYLASCGYRAGDVFGDPKFIGAPNFHLQSSSPAIDSGVNVGLPYSGLAPDLGAFESSYARTACANLADILGLGDGALVQLTTPEAATAASSTFADGSYNVEEVARTRGIKVLGGGSVVALGDRLTLNGVMSTDPSGERVIASAQILSHTAGSQLASLGIANGAAAAVSGLLVRLWGNVTFAAADDSYIYVDDGTGLNDGTGPTGVRVILSGLNVPLTTIPVPGNYVGVTGLAGKALDGAASIAVVRPRSDSDISIF
jgi:hypothetical protein